MTVGYYMIEPTILPGVSRFQEIEPFTDVIQYKIVSGYRWGKTQHFLTKPLYKLFDSYQTLNVKKEDLPPPPLIPWFPEDSAAEPEHIPLLDRVKRYFAR